jgi:hypothetical protein
VRPVLAFLLVSAVVALPAAGLAESSRTTCKGAVRFSGTPTVVVVLRGVSCAEAKRVLAGYNRGRPPRPWLCALAHAPFDRIGGRIVGLSCGWGAGPGNLRARRHAFVGTVAG